MNETFSRKNRLGGETFKVIRNGSRTISGCVHVYFRPGPGCRLAVVAGKKVGGSTRRNKLKRWAREIFRRNKDSLKNYDIVVIYKNGADRYTYGEIENILKKIWKRENLLKSQKES